MPKSAFYIFLLECRICGCILFVSGSKKSQKAKREKKGVTAFVSSEFVLSCQVTVPGQVVDVACGVDHMVALAKSLL